MYSIFTVVVGIPFTTVINYINDMFQNWFQRNVFKISITENSQTEGPYLGNNYKSFRLFPGQKLCVRVITFLGWVSQKAGYLTDPVKNRNSVTMIIIIANNTCGVNHIYRPEMYVGDTPPSI